MHLNIYSQFVINHLVIDFTEIRLRILLFGGQKKIVNLYCNQHFLRSTQVGEITVYGLTETAW